MNATRRWCGAGLVALGVAVALVSPACTQTTDDPITKYNPDTPDSASGTDSAADPDVSTLARPLCETLGGLTGVKKNAGDMLAKVAQDCRIGAYFATLSDVDKQHHADCFETFMASAAQCEDGTGNKISYIGAKDTRGEECQDIRRAHENLNLSRDDYQAFQEAVIAALTANNVTKAGQNGVIGILNGQPGVYDIEQTGNAMCTKGPACDNCVPTKVIKDGGLDAADATDAPTEGG